MNKHFVKHGSDYQVQPNTVIGLKYRLDCEAVVLGDGALIRSGSIIYADVRIGDHFQTGHNVLIRENTVIGDHVIIGTNTVIDGNVVIGDFVKIESNCYIPTHVKIGNRVFIGPNATLTNDLYPLKMRDKYCPKGPVIEDGVTLGGGVVVIPGVRIGRDSFIAAGALVTRDVPPQSMVKGTPANVFTLPEHLRERNLALSWRKYLNE